MNSKNKTICLSSEGDNLSSEIDQRFGRCAYFLVIKIENNQIASFKAIKNTGIAQASGAGINAAEQVGNLNINTLITGNIGPKANEVLSQLNIEIIKSSGKIKTAVEKYIKNLSPKTA